MRALRDSREIREVFKGLWEGRGLSEGWEQRRAHHRMGCGCGSVGLARWEDSHQTTQSLSNKQSSLLCAEPWFQYVGDNTTSDAGYLHSSCIVFWISVEITLTDNVYVATATAMYLLTL